MRGKEMGVCLNKRHRYKQWCDLTEVDCVALPGGKIVGKVDI